MSAGIEFSLDGRPLIAQPGDTILSAAHRAGVDIPHLCYKDGLRADGNCRACMVEIDGERALAPACCRSPAAGMQVAAESERARQAQRMVLELLRADVPAAARHGNSELERWCARLGVGEPRFAGRPEVRQDSSHPAIKVDLDACIQCTRCLRACRETQANDVIGYAGRGAAARIVFDQEAAMGKSSCVGCGECVQACPTGALRPAAAQLPLSARVSTLCPYCGVGCQVRYDVAGHGEGARIVAAEGLPGPANAGRLCVKGRYGYDYPRHAERLTRPLVRKPGVPKDPARPISAANWDEAFRVATWDEALDAAAAGLARIKAAQGAAALAGFGSAKGSNEEAYLFQKFVRAGMGTNNVDHCTRLCHASSVAALLEGLGSGAVSNPVSDVAHADVIIVIGANPAGNHPVAATFMKNAARRGAKLILMDPRATPLARHAWRHLQFKPDTDVAMLNALAYVIATEGLTDIRFIAERTNGYEEFLANLADYAPEKIAPVCGIDAATLREVARTYAGARAAMIFWGMGVSQHVHGTDNARCLIALALMSGQIGRPGTGLHPLRGQNNVQGASDAGLIPFMYPDYQRVSDGAVRARFEQLWRLAPGWLPAEPGLTVVEIMHAALAGRVRGMYIMGENPAMSDPDLAHARAGLAALDWLVVQDLFLTETAGFADVVLPASSLLEKQGSFTNTDRLVQISRPVLPLPGEARQDVDIIADIARRFDRQSGLDWKRRPPREVYEEMRATMPSVAGISWTRLERESAVGYPCPDESGPPQAVLFEHSFPTTDGRARFVPAHFARADELPDADYPLVLITGRTLEHWHTGAMTRRAAVLDALQPQAYAAFHPEDLAEAALVDGQTVRLQTRRGSVTARAVADAAMARGQVFMPFCYAEAAANLLTNDALDPFGKIPEFKFCALRVSAAETA